MYLEEICLSATDDDTETDQASADREIVAVLEQFHRIRRSWSQFTLFDNHRLMIETRRFLKPARHYTIETSLLDPRPKRSLKISWYYLLIFILLCSICLIAASGDTVPDASLLTFITGGGAGLSLVMAIYRSHDRVIFYSQHGRVPLVVLFNRLPDRKMLNSFTGTLAEHINKARSPNTSTDEMLSQELKAHRCLMEEGIISAKRYDIVKKRILGQHR